MNDLDTLLTSADPGARPASSGALDNHEVVERVWSRLQEQMAADESPGGGRAASAQLGRVARRRGGSRRGARRAVTLAAAFAVIGGGTAAAADYLASHTGEVNSGWEIAAGGPGENLRLDGTDFPEVLRSVTADIPFPTQAARDRALAGRDFAPEADTMASTGAVRGWTASWAICAWVQDWASSLDSDPVRAAAAVHVLDEARTWSAVTAVDPHPSMTGYRNDQGHGTPTQFGWLIPILDGVHAGSVTSVVDASQSNGYCRPDQAPDLPWTSPEFVRLAAASSGGGAR